MAHEPGILQRAPTFAFVFVTCFFAATVRADEPRRLVPIQGKPYSAFWTGCDKLWQLDFKAAEPKSAPAAEQRMSAADLVAWGAPAEYAARGFIYFAGGGMLAAQALSLDQERLVVESNLLGKLSLPLETVQAVILDGTLSPRQRQILEHRLLVRRPPPKAGAGHDRLLLANGDELSGTLVSFAAGRLELKTPAGTTHIELAKTAAIAMNPALLAYPRASGLRMLVGLSDGSRFSVRQLTRDAQRVEMVPLDGSAFDGQTWQVDAQAIVFLQTLGGRAVYLSDLKPASYVHLPYLEKKWNYSLDRSVGGGELQAGGRLYAKGIGMHSAARLTYRLEKPYARFAAELAIDDEAAERGNVTFRVFADREQKFASPVVRGGQPPLPISVDIRGARQLSLVVDFAEWGDTQDHADWLDARLTE